MAIIRPRLIDFYNIPITQEEVDFAIPFLDEDIPLYLDPFLLWKSPSQQDNALHLILINSFNKLGATYLKNEDKRELIAENLAGLSECSEVGLGSGKTKKGLKISINTAKEILDLFSIVPQYKTGGFSSSILQVFGLKTLIFANSLTGILYFLHSSCVKSIRKDFKKLHAKSLILSLDILFTYNCISSK